MHSVHNSNTFVWYFNKIDRFFADIIGAKNYIPYVEKVTMIAEWSYHATPLVRQYQNKLRYFWDLRNQLVHGFSLEKNHYVIASNYAVEQIKQIYALLTTPKTAFEVFGREVYICSLNDSLLEVIEMMRADRNTHVPVYNDAWEFVEMLSESTIAYWIAESNHGSLLIDKSVCVSAVTLENSNDTFAFIDKDKNVYEVQELFWKATLEKKRLWALFISEDWTHNTPIVWIITALDLPKLASMSIL